MKNEARISPECDTIQADPQNSKGVWGSVAGSHLLAVWKEPSYRLTRGDLRLIRQCANSDWDCPQETRDWLVPKVSEVFKSPRNEREKNSAMAVLLAMEGADFRGRMLDQRGTTHGIKALSKFPGNMFPNTRYGRKIRKSR
jgi:hypothetical protein